MKRYLLLLALVCLLGNRAQAQNENRKTYTMTTEKQGYIDFTGWQYNDNGQPDATIDWEGNQIEGISGTGTDGNPLERTYEEFPVYVGSGSLGDTYSSTTTTSTNIWSGNTQFNSWQVVVSIANSINVKAGDILRFNITNKQNNDFNPVLKQGGTTNDFFNNSGGNPQGPYIPFPRENTDNYFQWTVTDNNDGAIQAIINNGLTLQGLGFTLTSVELISTTTSTENTWGFWRNGTFGGTYLVKNGTNADYFNITNLKDGDVVTIWGDNGCRVTSNNTNQNNQDLTFNTNNPTRDVTMTSDGTLQLLFSAQWSGVRKIEIRRNEDQTTTFDYDPGYEEYDMYDEFSWIKNSNPATTYSLTGSAGFELNGTNAQYATFSGSKITTNNRIALTGNANDWTFDFGLVPPGNNGDYSFLSICNLREGDRVVISYINASEDPFVFASGYDSNGEFVYNGCAAFKDENRDGVINNGDEYINTETGEVTAVDWHRGEGNVGNSDQGQNSGYTPELYYTNSYVITQDGHLDLAFRRLVENYAQGQNNGKIVSRIVKIKIFSDHQAMMVDTWEEEQKHYKAYYNITGELQAKEHIMPGGLEIFVGNSDASQHALVVSSKDGPVSYVNAVDGFKIPGISKDENGKVEINFNLGMTQVNNAYDASLLPTTGTFYRFVPEVNGKMSFKFEAKSMNYYRYDLKGNAIYHNTDLTHINRNNNGTWDNEADDYYELVEGNYGNWGALNDRPNEQTVDAGCPYYLVRIYEENEQKKMEVTNLGAISNGGDYTSTEITVVAGDEYYLFGGWNQSDLYYNSSWIYDGNMYQFDSDTNHRFNNIEFRPFDGRTVGCGVAQLLWVTFDPNKKIYPLAKWVPNGTRAVNDDNPVPNPDTFVAEKDLADLWGYEKAHTTITVKKMAGNIVSCDPYIEDIPRNQQVENGPTAKLKIKDIVFDTTNGKNPGGTILIKIGEPTNREDPVYALTIAYSADEAYDNQQSEVIKSKTSKAVRGHIWDFHTSSLNGLTWTNGTAYGAVEKPMGTYFDNYYSQSIANYSSAAEVQDKLDKNEDSFLFDEVENEGDWLFNYNLLYDGNMFDPVFTNKYDMVGDNADMIWDTEGTIFQTSGNHFGIFNEYVNGDETDNADELEVVDHTATSTTPDPNRYVALLKDGVFRIPWLMPNDRVIIWMGSGTGRTDDFASLKIKNAYDALHNPIDPNDDYIVGGSQWNGANEDSNYRGCYHFFAKGNENSTATGKAADMVFEMTGGEMCKIYKVRIYRGDRIITNDVIGATENDKFLLTSTDNDPNDPSSTFSVGASSNWMLKYLGKEQQLANGVKGNTVNTNLPTQDNEIIAKTGIINSDISTDAANNTFTYVHDLGEIGTFRVRGKDMEKNMNYVADYADHNVTIAYQQTQKYPYTWDFTDMVGFGNIDNLYQPEENIGEVKPAELDEDVWNSLANTSYQKTSRDLSLWEVNGTEGECFLRLNSQSQTLTDLKERDNIFETAMAVDGNQFWANGQVVPETQGLWFYTGDNYRDNSEWHIDSNGMKFNGYNGGTLVVPNVPAGAAVYLRMAALKTDVTKCTFTHQFKDKEGVRTCEVYAPHQVESTNEYIFAILNNGDYKGNLTLSIEGYQLKKLAVSKDPKKVNIRGWATESRDHVIDPELTAYMTGKNLETFLVTGVNYENRTISLQRVYPSDINSYVMSSLENEDKGASIIHNADVESLTADNGEVSILNGGFHLFVPDMHDYDKKTDKGIQKKKTDKTSMLVARVTPTTSNDKISGIEGDYTNYALTYKYLRKSDGIIADDEELNDGAEAFYRIAINGASSSGNQGYLPLLTNPETNSGSGSNGAKYSIIFEDVFEDVNPGITTTIDDIESSGRVVTSEGFYNLNGQKLNGIPTQKGMYIVNGKKVLVK